MNFGGVQRRLSALSTAALIGVLLGNPALAQGSYQGKTGAFASGASSSR